MISLNYFFSWILLLHCFSGIMPLMLHQELERESQQFTVIWQVLVLDPSSGISEKIVYLRKCAQRPKFHKKGWGGPCVILNALFFNKIESLCSSWVDTGGGHPLNTVFTADFVQIMLWTRHFKFSTQRVRTPCSPHIIQPTHYPHAYNHHPPFLLRR